MTGILTVEETARWLRVSPKTVRRLVKDGTLPHMRIPGGRLLRFREQDLELWLSRRATEPRQKVSKSIQSFAKMTAYAPEG